MDDGVKQRIVGSFVLLALLVIFLPVFFDRERIAPVDRETQIPLAPELEDSELDIQELEIDLTQEPRGAPGGAQAPSDVQSTRRAAPPPQVPEPRKPPPKRAEARVEPVIKPKPLPTMPPDTSVAPEKMYTPDDSAPQPDTSAKPSLDDNGVPQSWVLQVGSFRFEGHAKQMRDDIVKMGFRAFVRDVETGNGKMTRVYVGPKLDKSRLLEAQKAVEAKYKLKGIVLKFKP